MIASERGGAPSASAMERLSLCAGSHQASAGIKEPESEAARSGSRIHGLVAGEQVIDATTEELDMAGRCAEMAEAVAQRFFGHGLAGCNVTREERLWSEGRAFSGQADLVAISGSKALIVDFKTGRGEVQPSATNQQLRALAVLVSEQSELDTVAVAIVQPLATSTPVLAWYDAKDLTSAAVEVYWTVAEAAAPEAKRVAGEIQCKYCAARSRCPEANAEVAALAVIPEGVMALTSEQLSRRLDVCKVAESVIDALRDEAKRRLETGESVAGWELRAGITRETITNPQEVYARFDAAGGTVEQFLGAVTVAKGKLQDAYKLATGAKGKELQTKMESLLSGCVETKQNAPSLVKTK